MIPTLYFLFQIGPNCIQIQTTEKHKVLGYSFHIKDIFLPNEIEDVSYMLNYIYGYIGVFLS